MMNKVILLFFLTSLLFAQRKEEINFDFDFSEFSYNDSINYVEFYYQVEKDNFNVVTQSGKNVISAILEISLSRISDNVVIVDKKYGITGIKDSLSNESELLGQFSIPVPVGEYNLRFTVFDKFNPKLSKTLNDELSVKPFPKDKPSLSNIELSRNIIKSDEKNSIFYKNTYKIIPNPNRVFSVKEPVVFYYAETYNLKSAIGKNLVFLAVVLNSNGEKVVERKTKLMPMYNSLVKVGQFNLSGKPTGVYKLLLALVDSSVNYAYTSSKRFFMINPNMMPVPDSSTGKISVSSRFSGMSNDEADLFFKKLRYLASKEDKTNYNQLKTPEQKQRFLTKFWKSRDKTPDTPENEFMNDYMRRLDFVNKKFKTRTRPGFMTDMGRVYLTYGPPDTIDRYPNNISTKPYELWYYHNIEGGVVFVFVDMIGIGNYDLVHSTKRGEVNNIRWRQLIGE
jgi:GWxTD domain-containing protein